LSIQSEVSIITFQQPTKTVPKDRIAYPTQCLAQAAAREGIKDEFVSCN
jgi:hypothetical protein